MNGRMPLRGALIASVAVLAAACTAEQPTQPTIDAEPNEALAKKASPTLRTGRAMLNRVNRKLARSGAEYRVARMEYITEASSGEVGQVIIARDVGNKQDIFHFAPDLVAYPGYVTYAVDESEGAANGGLTPGQTTASIEAAMATWGSQKCSSLPIARVSFPIDLGVWQWALGYGGSGYYLADINHAGWLPPAFFDDVSLDGQGGSYILGVTITFIWIDGGGNPIDTNRDGKIDAAFREIYYNDAFAWSDQPQGIFSGLIDVESIALHEAGHGLSQAHFGKIFIDGSGKHGHFAPLAVMNAAYFFSQRELLGSDKAGHCSLWAGWN